MRFSKIVGAVGLVTFLSLLYLPAEASEYRKSVTARIKAVCAVHVTTDCISSIRAELTLAAQLGKSPNGLAIALGLADAVVDIGNDNPTLRSQLTTIVATEGENFLKVAFGAVLDGAGGPAPSVGNGARAGSAG